MKPKPPKKALNLLRRFCKKEYIEEFEGDLIEIFEEQYEQSPSKARRTFHWNVIRHFRLEFIKPLRFKHSSNSVVMFQHNLKVSWRSLKKQPFFTLLNTLGLAIGMAGVLLISLFVYDELSFDKMFADADRIYRIDIDNTNGGETNKYASVAAPLGPRLKQDYPQIELVTRFKISGSILLRQIDQDQNIKEEHIAGVDSTFFEMFGLELLVGDEKTALREPNTLILTKSAAKKHFGIDDALGQSLLIDDKDVYIVTGVMDDLPLNSFLRDYGVFISMATFKDAEGSSWANWSFPTFIKLTPHAQISSLQAPLNTIYEVYMIPWIQTFDPSMTLEKFRASRNTSGNLMAWSAIHLTDIHLHSTDRKKELSTNSDIQNIYILSVIGFFLVLLACVNFMNLSTAQALKRIKEVGIRKTLGSYKFALIKQFLTEASLIAFLSILVAITLVATTLPFFNELSGKHINIPFNHPLFWLSIISFTLLLGVLSGAYPAFFMSNFTPVIALKGNGNFHTNNKGIRNYLVIFQFSISVFLIISTLVVYQQLTFIQNKDLGYQKDQVLVINDVDAMGDQAISFKQEVAQIGQVSSTSLSSYLPTPSDRYGMTFFVEGERGLKHDGLIFERWTVDDDYIPALDMNLIAGRNFDKHYGTDANSIILNESAVAMLGVEPKEALGMRLTNDFKRPDKENMEFSTVIGVVQNFHFESMRNTINAMSLSLGDNAKKMIIKLKAGDFAESIYQIEDIWREMAPGQPFSYYFMDDSFNDTYKAEQRLGSIFIVFTMLSIFIACLGLFGLSAFNAEKRVKEIGIRKVLGASIKQITFRLTKDFLRLVGIAIVIAFPISWYAMSKWLQDFSYRIEISGWVFLIAASLAIMLSILTVSYQSIKAAMAAPVRSLRNE